MDRRFAVESILVEAGPVQVFQAQDSQLGRAVALVRVAPGGARLPLLSFITTAAAAGGEHLQHVLSLDFDRGQAVLESQLGESLPLPAAEEEQALRWAEQIGAALAPLHSAGAAHGAVTAASLTHCAGVLILALTPALVQRGEPRPADDVATALDLLGLSSEEPLEQGSALAAWARRRRLALNEQQDTARVEGLVEAALATAPPDVNRGRV